MAKKKKMSDDEKKAIEGKLECILSTSHSNNSALQYIFTEYGSES